MECDEDSDACRCWAGGNDVCDKVEEINCGIWDEWAYGSLDACYDGLGGDCEDFQAYLNCMCACLDLSSCDDFQPCEIACCGDNC